MVWESYVVKIRVYAMAIVRATKIRYSSIGELVEEQV